MSQKVLIGAHTSAAGGSFRALYEGAEIGATTIQLFTSNQKQWQGRAISDEEILQWEETLATTGIEMPMSHAGYLINLGSPEADLLRKSRKAFQEEIKRCHLLNIPLLNVHPGSATKGTEEACLETIVESLLSFAPLLEQGKTRILLETTAGQGTSVGHRFEQLGFLVDRVKQEIPIGICIDTCHIFVAGYDIRTEESWKEVLKEFDAKIGLSHLYAFHLNDSVRELGSRVDRHAALGAGKIGIESFRFVMQHPKTADLPKYLETPEGPPLWKKEIALLRQFYTEER